MVKYLQTVHVCQYNFDPREQWLISESEFSINHKISISQFSNFFTFKLYSYLLKASKVITISMSCGDQMLLQISNVILCVAILFVSYDIVTCKMLCSVNRNVPLSQVRWWTPPGFSYRIFPFPGSTSR